MIDQQIPPDARQDSFTATNDLDLAACCLCDDQILELPAEDISVFVENSSRLFVFRFPTSDHQSEIFQSWKTCQQQGVGSVNGNSVGYIYSAFIFFDRIISLIRKGIIARRQETKIEGFWTINTKAPAAALAVAKVGDIADDRLARMILKDGNQHGYLMRDPMFDAAFIDPLVFCASRPPNDPLAVIVAGFFFRERLRDIVNAKRARHVFREVGENGLPKISFIAEPEPGTC